MPRPSARAVADRTAGEAVDRLDADHHHPDRLSPRRPDERRRVDEHDEDHEQRTLARDGDAAQGVGRRAARRARARLANGVNRVSTIAPTTLVMTRSISQPTDRTPQVASGELGRVGCRLAVSGER